MTKSNMKTDWAGLKEQNPIRLLSFSVVAILLSLFSFQLIAFAGRSDKAGTAAASELLIPVGASSIGLGGSNLSYVSGIEALFWNPAGIVRSPMAHGAMFSHMSYIADIGIEYVAVSTRLDNFGTFGLSVKSLSIGEIPITTEDFPDGTGQTASPTFVILGGALSRMITDKISFGVTANYIIEKMEKVSANGIAFTGGLQYDGLGGVEGLSMGVVVRNIGPGIQFEGDGLSYNGILDGALSPSSSYNVEASTDDLPSTIEVGLGYHVQATDDVNLQWGAIFQNNNFSSDEYKVGLEAQFMRQLALRYGFSFADEEGGSSYLFGSTLGLGIQTKLESVNLSFDYSYRMLTSFSNNHCISIRLGME